MAIEIQTTFGFNCLYWITSLNQHQVAWPRKIVANLEPIFKKMGFPLIHREIGSSADLFGALDDIAAEVSKGMRPLLHLYMHGNEQGLGMAETGELALWTDVFAKLRAINLSTKGSLCLIANACYAYHALKTISIQEACPVRMLIAPESKVFVDFLEAETAKFYEATFASGRIDEAFRAHLSAQLSLFGSDHFFTRLLARYIKENCLGAAGEARVNRLVEEKIAEGNIPDTPANRKILYDNCKASIQPSQALLDKYADQFMPGVPCPVRIEQIMEIVGN